MKLAGFCLKTFGCRLSHYYPSIMREINRNRPTKHDDAAGTGIKDQLALRISSSFSIVPDENMYRDLAQAIAIATIFTIPEMVATYLKQLLGQLRESMLATLVILSVDIKNLEANGFEKLTVRHTIFNGK